MYAKIATTFIFSLLLTSCGTTRLSPNNVAKVTEGTHAIVETNNQPILASIIFDEQPVTQIIAVDGKKTDDTYLTLDESITIDVGLHKITFSCKARGGYDERDLTETLTLDLKPYHKYSVRCSFDSNFGPKGTYTGVVSVKEIRISQSTTDNK